MKGDFTRFTHNPTKHYSRVLMQQGRVQVDADWNEELDILDHHSQLEKVDIIGQCGAPQAHAGFAILPDASVLKADELKRLREFNHLPLAASDFLVGKGRYYVNGTLCENDRHTTYMKQPDMPVVPPITNSGVYLAYLDVWQRHITALEDREIREVALGGPDTATRSKTVWQLKLLRAGDVGADFTCLSDLEQWKQATAAPTGKLSAQAKTEPPASQPCIIPADSGFRRLENQLYRVEVHREGSLGHATFKWSRDNGSVVTSWLKQNVNDLTVSSLGKDKILNFAAGQWIELIDDTHELMGAPGTLVKISKAEGDVVTVDPLTATGSINLADFPSKPRIRRWDSEAELKPSASAGFILLEDGVQVKFENGTYRTGDYWLIPARTITGDVEWPKDSAKNPIPQLPRGIDHDYCRIALLSFDGKKWSVLSDCRKLFPPLTELTDFFFVGGDGQEAEPGQPLPQLLQVGVMNGAEPLVKEKVRFVAQFGGKVAANAEGFLAATNSLVVETGIDGVASCAWMLDPDINQPSQQVTATLLNKAGNPAPNIALNFTANHERAEGGSNCCVTVGNGGDFHRIDQAIETLLKLGKFDICLCLMPGDHELPRGLVLAVKRGDRKVNLKIMGCGLGSRILVSKGQMRVQGLASFVLRDVALRFRDVSSPLFIDQCAVVEVSSTHVAGIMVDTNPLLGIRMAQKITIKGNTIHALKAGSLELPSRVFQITRELDIKASHLFETEDDEEFDKQVIPISEQFAALGARQRKSLIALLATMQKKYRAQMSTMEATAYARFVAATSTGKVDAEEIAVRIRAIRKAALRKTYGTALVIMDGNAITRIEDNDIIGVVSLYGIPGESEFAKDELETLGGLFRKAGLVTLNDDGADVYLLNNHLTKMGIGDVMHRQIHALLNKRAKTRVVEGIFRTGFLDNNLFDSGENYFLASSLALSTCCFNLPAPRTSGKEANLGLAGVAWSASAVFTGNRATIPCKLVNISTSNNAPETDRKAANLMLSIEDR